MGTKCKPQKQNHESTRIKHGIKKIILTVEKAFLNIIQNSKAIKEKFDKLKYLYKRKDHHDFLSINKSKEKPGINIFKVYFRQKANVLHMQRASQINETNNSIEKK